MAIKINELQVNVNFENQEITNVPSDKNVSTNSVLNESIVEITVKEVLRILKEKKER